MKISDNFPITNTTENSAITLNSSKIEELIRNISDKINLEQDFLPKTIKNKFDYQELIIYQIKANHYHLKIEILSKAAESFTQVFKKIQANQ